MARYGVTVVTSKSYFLPEEPERRISKGYCRGVRPSNIYMYLCIYWAGGPIRGYKIVREGVNITKGVCVKVKRLVLTIRVHKGCPRRNTFSASQSRGPKGWSTIQGSVPRDSIDTDKHHRSEG